jgi:hypothetical protein
MRLFFLLLVAAFAALLPGQACAQGQALEYAVKATYLYKFGPFVDWPANAFSSATSPVGLCIVGDDPFGAVADRAVAGQAIDGRSIVLRRLRSLDPNIPCHIMYVSGSAQQTVGSVLETVKGRPTLTITDGARDPATKGIIHFVIHDNKVRFEIDDQAAAESRILISSKVLSLAVSVRARGAR